MPTALDELFMAEAMTGSVRRFAEQSEERSFWKYYEGGERLSPVTDVVKWDEVRFSRDLAPVTGPNSPSKATKPLGIIKRTGELFAVKEHVDLDGRLLKMARGEGSTLPDPAGYLNANLLNLTNRAMRTLNLIACKSFLTTNGQVDLGAIANADIASGSFILTYPVNSANAAVSWAAASTKIRSTEINPLKLAYRKGTGFAPGIAIASDDVEGYLVGNTEATELLKNGSFAGRTLESSFMEGGNSVRYGGMEWRFARDQYYADATPDTAVDIPAATDLVAILPPENRHRECFALAEGIQLIPTGAIASLATGNPFSLIAETRGWFAYLELITNPIGVRLHVGYCGLPIQKVQKSVLVFNAIP
ncbi:MAG TPA: hypothetical protein VEA38_16870 [Terriglobales bacterium]|nr:hypothetical protein [Terriglobales bacterium]